VVDEIAVIAKGTSLLTLADGGSLPLPIFLAGVVRVVTQNTGLRVPKLGLGGGNVFYETVAKNTSPAVALYLALTRKKIFASDMLYTGLATHFTPAKNLTTLLMIVGKAVVCPPPHTHLAVAKSLASLVEYAGPSRLQTLKDEIEKHFQVRSQLPSYSWRKI